MELMKILYDIYLKWQHKRFLKKIMKSYELWEKLNVISEELQRIQEKIDDMEGEEYETN